MAQKYFRFQVGVVDAPAGELIRRANEQLS